MIIDGVVVNQKNPNKISNPPARLRVQFEPFEWGFQHLKWLMHLASIEDFVTLQKVQSPEHVALLMLNIVAKQDLNQSHPNLD